MYNYLKIWLIIYSISNTYYLFGQDWYEVERADSNSLEQTVQLEEENSLFKVMTNWEKGYLEFESDASVDMSKMNNDAQAIVVAKETARFLAYSRAVEYLEGARLLRQTGIGSTQLLSDKFQIEIKGLVKNAIVINESFEWVKNENAPGKSPMAHVKIGLLLYGGKPDNNLINTLFPESIRMTESAGITKYKIDKSQIAKVKKKFPDINNKYTGMVIDTRGLNVKPSLFPSIIVVGTRKQLFGDLTGKRSYILKYGLAGYATDMQKAIDDERVSVSGKSNCYIIKAVKYNNTDNSIEISSNDAQVASLIDLENKILSECKVMIVIDK